MIIGIGIDIIEIDRIAAAYAKSGERFTRRILTPLEKEYCLQFTNPVPEIAARFAAKEAFSKAIGTGISRGVAWRQIEVVKDRGRPPRIRVTGRAAEVLARLEGGNIQLSLTHAEAYAAAVVTIEKI